MNAGESAKALASEYRVSDASIYLWRKKQGSNGKALVAVKGKKQPLAVVIDTAHSDLIKASKQAMLSLKHYEDWIVQEIRAGNKNTITDEDNLATFALNQLRGTLVGRRG